mmetsp:Transcript_32252/g.30741  ORF Transcript_32252/g.30741 Transcript_32252/m.30741 type:complete len:267 (+) Transcript_32252:51-851(+)
MTLNTIEIGVFLTVVFFAVLTHTAVVTRSPLGNFKTLIPSYKPLEGIRNTFRGSRIECNSWIIGKYSNEKQSLAGAANGKLTATDGGHEYVCAEIKPHPQMRNVVIASYYFDDDVSKTFRYRYYEFDTSFNKEIIMRLYRPTLAAEDSLKKLKYNVPEEKLLDLKKDFEYLDGCDVRFSKELSCYQGRLVNGECKVCSLNDPEIQLTIKDDLKLWKNELWINDRVFTSEGKQIIGNKDGIPYKMRKEVRTSYDNDPFGAKKVYETW